MQDRKVKKLEMILMMLPWLAALGVSACSGHDKPRVVATGIDLHSCVVDGTFIYGDDGGQLYKIDRASGVADAITNDTRGVRDLVAIDGALYWLDSEGVHVWARGATTRRTIDTFKSSQLTSSLVQFDRKICWIYNTDLLADDTAWTNIRCLSLDDNTVKTWISLPFLNRNGNHGPYLVALTTSAGRLYGAANTDDGRTCTLYDLTTSSAPVVTMTAAAAVVVTQLPTSCGTSLAMTSSGLAAADPVASALWLTQPQPHAVTVVGGLIDIRTVGTSTYVTRSEGPAQVDPSSGAVSPLADVTDPLLCGDEKHLYARGFHARGEVRARKTIVELPNRNLVQ